jgi:hypothetical protein
MRTVAATPERTGGGSVSGDDQLLRDIGIGLIVLAGGLLFALIFSAVT